MILPKLWLRKKAAGHPVIMKRKAFKINRTAARMAAALALVAVVYVVAFAGQVEITNRWERRIDPGVMYYHYVGRVNGSPVHIYIAEIDMSRGDLRVQPVLAWDRMERLETVTSMAKRHSPLVAINGSYFNRASSDTFPIGFVMMDGRVVYFSHQHRSAFGLTRDNKPLFGYPRTRGSIYVEDKGKYFLIHGMNRERKKNEPIVYTFEYGQRTNTKYAEREIVVRNNVVTEIGEKNMAIPSDGFVISLHGESMQYADLFKKGSHARLYFVIEAEWLRVYNALTGGPLLLQNGNSVVEFTKSEKFRYSINERNPLTAVASKPDGKILFVVVDGRRPGFSVGLSWVELTWFLKSIGADNALAMDGGGSSIMIINGEVVNKPSDGSPREVSNALCVFKKK